MIEIDLPRAVELVLECIAEKPEGFSYRDYEQAKGEVSCVNVFVDTTRDEFSFTPACLIGGVIAKAGITPESIYLAGAARAAFHSTASCLRERITFTEAAQEYLQLVQSRQDNEHTWAVSHANAIESMLRYYRHNHVANESELAWLTQA
jgi:hypothetical protein